MKSHFSYLAIMILAIGFGWQTISQPLPASAATEPACLISISVFDDKTYDATIIDQELTAVGLIQKGDFQNGFKTLPFKTVTKAQGIVQGVADTIEIKLCGGVGKCNSKLFVMQVNCDSGITSANAIKSAQVAFSSRTSSMNPCEKDVFTNLQNNSTQYLKSVKQANLGYYQQMAPLTAAFRIKYRNAKTAKDRQDILTDYHSQNQASRQKMYQSQAQLLNDFVSQSKTLKQDFSNCSK